jgi:hypothetical protein
MLNRGREAAVVLMFRLSDCGAYQLQNRMAAPPFPRKPPR